MSIFEDKLLIEEVLRFSDDGKQVTLVFLVICISWSLWFTFWCQQIVKGELAPRRGREITQKMFVYDWTFVIFCFASLQQGKTDLLFFQIKY